MDSLTFADKQVAPSTSTAKQEEIKMDTGAPKNKRSIEAVFENHASINGWVVARRRAFVDKKCELYGRIHADVFNIDKLLLDDIALDIEFYKN